MHEIFNPKPEDKSKEHVDARDSRLHYLYGKVVNDGDEFAHSALIEELESRDRYNKFFKVLYPEKDEMELNLSKPNFECYRHLIDTFEDGCGRFSDYGLKFAKYFSHTCAENKPEEIKEVITKIRNICDAIM